MSAQVFTSLAVGDWIRPDKTLPYSQVYKIDLKLGAIGISNKRSSRTMPLADVRGWFVKRGEQEGVYQ